MADLYRLVVRMDGFPGAPGYMTFHCATATPFRSAVIAFIDAVKTAFPADVTFTVPIEIDLIDDASGTLLGVETEGTTYTTSGSGSGGYSAASGACISWSTGVFVGGRRLKGRTFLVPLTGLAYEADGSIAAATLTQLRNAAVTLFTSCDLAIWRRPHVADPSKPGDVSYVGSQGEVIGATVADRAAVLRSRRA